MRNKSLRLMVAAMGMAAYASKESRDIFHDESENISKKIDPYKKMERPLKGNQKKYSFDDGFTCIATNQRNADRKHNNWINKK